MCRLFIYPVTKWTGMRIGVDIRSLASGRQSGVESYVTAFLDAVVAAHPQHEFVLFFNAYRDIPVDLTWAERHPNVTVRRFRIPNKLLNLAIWYCGRPRIDRLLGGVDVLFLPNINFCAVSDAARLVITMHDLSFVHYPQTFSLRRRLWHAFVNPRRLARRADAIVAVSAATADDVALTYHVPAAKVHVIRSAVGDRFRPVDRNDLSLVEVRRRYRLPYRFILFLGTVEPRKNIVSLVTAFEALCRRHPGAYDDLHLVVAGMAGWRDEAIHAAVASSPLRDRIHMIGSVDEADKNALYGLASVFAYPSFFEGFGFPPLEAMACGVPVVTSNATSLPEVVGDGALMIDPDRPEELMHALHAVLSDRDLAAELVRRGLRRAMAFSWEESARRFGDVLAAVAALRR